MTASGDSVLSMAAGILSKSVSTVATFPISRGVALLQVEGAAPALLGAPPRPYKAGFFGFADVIRQTASSLGWRANWRGAPFAALAPAAVAPLTFAANDFVHSMMPRPAAGDQQSVGARLAANVARGALAGALTLPLSFFAGWPVLLAQADLRPEGQRLPARGHLGQLALRPALTASLVARALPVTALGVAVYRGLYFGLYNTLNESFNPMRRNQGAAGFVSKMGIGYATTLAAMFAAYPTRVVLSRLVVANVAAAGANGGAGAPFVGVGETARAAMAGRGVRGLYRGFMSNVTLAVAGALMLVLYDGVKGMIA